VETPLVVSAPLRSRLCLGKTRGEEDIEGGVCVRVCVCKWNQVHLLRLSAVASFAHVSWEGSGSGRGSALPTCEVRIHRHIISWETISEVPTRYIRYIGGYARPVRWRQVDRFDLCMIRNLVE
jgi:hypothetical protein